MATGSEGESSKLPSSGTAASFPNEVFHLIFQGLSPVELSRLAQTSRQLHQVCQTSSLWEQAYFAFWRDEDERRSDRRRIRRWRENRRLASLRDTARQAWMQQWPGKMAEEEGTLPTFISSSSAARQDAHKDKIKAQAPPNFYKLFLERIAIDQEVLQEIYSQCTDSKGWIHRIDRLVAKHGNDMKDILHALICVQQQVDSDHDVSRVPVKSKDQAVNSASSDFPSAFHLRLPHAKRSETHHLSILHYGRELLEHLQCREAMHGLVRMRSDTSPSHSSNAWSALRPLCDLDLIPTQDEIDSAQVAKEFENGLCYLSMFRGGEGQEISEELDVLATSCALYLRRCCPGHEADAEQTVRGICDFLGSRGFRGANEGEFHNLDNNFVHLCLDESGRESLPLTLVVIFCSVATRLGLRAFPTNTPIRMMAVVIDDKGKAEGGRTSGEARKFWVNVYGEGQILHPGDHLSLILRRIPMNDDAMMGQGEPASCTLRAARNIIASVQRAQVLPTFNTSPIGELANQRLGNRRLSESDIRSSHTITVPDQIFENQAYSSKNLFNPRRTFRHPASQTLHLTSPFWAEAMQSKAHPHRPAKRASSTDKELFWATTGRYRRVAHWPESTQHAAMHAASNAFTRLGDELGERGTEWSMGLVKSFFPLDILVMFREMVGNIGGSLGRMDEDDTTASATFNLEQFRESPSYARNSARVESVAQTYESLMTEDQTEPVPKLRRHTTDSRGYTVTVPIANAPSGDAVFRVGSVFAHRLYGYRAVIVRWDERCEAAEEWIVNMNVDSLPNGGRNQPFYQAMVDDGSTRYVAHCNVDTARLATEAEEEDIQRSRAANTMLVEDRATLTSDDLERVLAIRGIGRLFRCAAVEEDHNRQVVLQRNRLGEVAFPEDD